MKVEGLEKIIASMDLQRINGCLLERGFRLAYPNLIWQYQDLFSADKNIIQEAVYNEENRYCKARVYQNSKKYGSIALMELVFMEKTLFYSNAPLDEAYERELSKEEKCSNCQKVYSKKSLVEYCDKLLCPQCLYEVCIKEFGEKK